MAKMGAPFKGVVYFNGEQPMVIDVNGKGGACLLVCLVVMRLLLLLLLLLRDRQTGTHRGVRCEDNSAVPHTEFV